MKRLFFALGLCLFITACHKHTYYQGYIEGEYTDLASNFGGKLEQLPVKRGDHIKAGQLVYALDDQSEQAALTKAKAELRAAQETLNNLKTGQRRTVMAALEAQRKQAQATLNLAKINLERMKYLYERQAIDKANYDQAITEHDRSEERLNEINANIEEAKLGQRDSLIKAQIATVNAAEAAVRQMEWQLAQKKIYAPVTGLVFETYYQTGEFVAPQRPVVTLLAPEHVKAIFYVPEKLRKRLRIGETIEFNCDDKDKIYRAKINFISPQAEYTPPVIFSRETREKLVYRVEASLSVEDAQQLNPGQPIDVVINAPLSARAKS